MIVPRPDADPNPSDAGYLEIALAVPGEYLQSLTDAIQDVVPSGFSIEEPFVPLGPEEGARLEPWRPTIVKLYLPVDDRLAERRHRLTDVLASLRVPVESSERPVQEEDWAQSWKEFFQIERVGNGIVIRPSWRSYEPAPGEIVLDLDPGMAFGTGQHPTTRLCLAALEEFTRAGMDILDLGCGSGILSLAAAKLGAAAVLALDIELVAVEATRANAERNGVQSVVRAERGSLEGAWPWPEPPTDIADLVVANISATVLVDLAGAIQQALRPRGVFLGSGVIAERTDEVLVALAAARLSVEEIRTDGDWRLIIARQPLA